MKFPCINTICTCFVHESYIAHTRFVHASNIFHMLTHRKWHATARACFCRSRRWLPRPPSPWHSTVTAGALHALACPSRMSARTQATVPVHLRGACCRHWQVSSQPVTVTVTWPGCVGDSVLGVCHIPVTVTVTAGRPGRGRGRDCHGHGGSVDSLSRHLVARPGRCANRLVGLSRSRRQSL